MDIAYLSHPDCQRHEIAPGHPEQPARVRAVDEALRGNPALAAALRARTAPLASTEQLKRAHTDNYVDELLAQKLAPGESLRLDADTAINPWSCDAARRAAGAVVDAVDTVLTGDLQRAFCNVRPPGHHAEHDKAMGFCLFNSIAVGALHAIHQHGLQRVAVVDFDVHFGNGSSDILRGTEQILLLSSCQFPLYPLSEMPVAAHNEVNIVLPEGSNGQAFRNEVEQRWQPALVQFQPQLILISAGFDSHADDPLAGLNWQAEDYAWITRRLCELHTGPIVSSLEGGYDLDALAASAVAHVQALTTASTD